MRRARAGAASKMNPHLDHALPPKCPGLVAETQVHPQATRLADPEQVAQATVRRVEKGPQGLLMTRHADPERVAQTTVRREERDPQGLPTMLRGEHGQVQASAQALQGIPRIETQARHRIGVQTITWAAVGVQTSAERNGCRM